MERDLLCNGYRNFHLFIFWNELSTIRHKVSGKGDVGGVRRELPSLLGAPICSLSLARVVVSGRRYGWLKTSGVKTGKIWELFLNPIHNLGQ